jgi:cytosine/adenosine deaminase-related metal-dependent hydrolase
MIFRARAVVTMDGAPIENGAVAVKDGVIVAVGGFDEVARIYPGTLHDLGERVILPGLINAHCHLDYSMMRRTISPQQSFTEWIKRINALKRSLDDDDYLQAIARGFGELKKWGTTTVLNIEAFPELLPKMPPPPIRTWWFYEMIDIRQRIATEELVAGAFLFFQKRPDWLGGFGLSPHAPYTASAELYQLANECARVTGMPLTTHLAESEEEEKMFRHSKGALHDFMAQLGRNMGDCGNSTAFAHLYSSGLAGGDDWLLVHLNELTEEDFQLIAQRANGTALHVAHCPVSHRYFGHKKFEFKRLRDLGANICLGTDSLASNDTLNLFAEMRALQKTEPWLRAEELLASVTVNPALALRRADDLGKITPGACADLISLPFSGGIATVCDEIVNHEKPIDWMMVDGRIIS